MPQNMPYLSGLLNGQLYLFKSPCIYPWTEKQTKLLQNFDSGELFFIVNNWIFMAFFF